MSEDFITFMHELADLAGEQALAHFRTGVDVEDKGGVPMGSEPVAYDPVTEADRSIERVWRDAIGRRWPDHGIVGEEYGREEGRSAYHWTLDPIDGTRSFVAGFPTWGCLMAVSRDGEPVAGMMVQPFVGERFWGDCQTAHFSGPRGSGVLKTRTCPADSGLVFSTTSPELFEDDERGAFERARKRANIVRYGGDCYGYCLLAGGTVDLIVEAGLAAYDIAALIPIITGAGGRVTSWQNGSAADGGQVLAVGDPAIHAEMVELLASG